MAVVWRNGRAYCYRSVRRGGRVTSEYRGRACLADLKDPEEQAERRERAERKEADRLEADLDALAEQARRLAHEVLGLAGYHQHHRGEWRRKRHVEQD